MDFDRVDPILTDPQIIAVFDALLTVLAGMNLDIEWDANRRGDVTFTVSQRSPAMTALLEGLASQPSGPLVTRAHA